MPGAVLYREGGARAADHRDRRGHRRRPGLADPVPRGRPRATAPTRCAGAYLESVVRPERSLGRGDVLLARGHRRRRSAASTAPSSARCRTSTGSARPRCSSSVAGRSAASTFRRSARSSGSSRRAAARSSSTPSRSTCGRRRATDAGPERPTRPRDGRPQRTAAPIGRVARRRTRGPATAPPSHDPRDRRPDALPGDARGPLGASIPGRIQEQGLATIRVHDLRDWGLGPPPLRRRHAVRRGSGHGPAPEPVAAALDALRRPDSTVILLDPGGEVFRQARAADLADATAPRLRLPALRGRRRAHPRRSSTSSSRSATTSDRRRAPGARRHRRGDPPAAGRDRRRLDGRGVVLRRAARVPAVHAPAVVPRHGRPGDPDVGRPRRRRPLAHGSRRSSGRARAGRTCSTTRATPAADRLSGEARAILRRRSPFRDRSKRPTAATAAHQTKEPPRERARRDRPGPAPHRPAGARHG